MNGNVIVGQSGGPTSVINSSLVGVFQGAKRAGCGKIYGMRNGLEGLLQERYVELNDCIKNDLDIEILKRDKKACRIRKQDKQRYYIYGRAENNRQRP